MAGNAPGGSLSQQAQAPTSPVPNYGVYRGGFMQGQRSGLTNEQLAAAAANGANGILPGLGPNGYQFTGGQHETSDYRGVLERAGMEVNPENRGAFDRWNAQNAAAQAAWRQGAALDPNVHAQQGAARQEAGAMGALIPGFGQNGNWGTFDQRVAAANTVVHPGQDVFRAAAIRNQPLNSAGGQAAATDLALNPPAGHIPTTPNPNGSNQPQASAPIPVNRNPTVGITPQLSTDGPRRVTRLQRRR